MSVPPHLVPELVIAGENLLIIATQKKRHQLPRVLLIRNPLDLVTLLRIAHAMSVRAYLLGICRIGGLGPGAPSLTGSHLKSREIPVQLLDLGHQIRVKPTDLDSGFA